jgi:hypothetical protein
MVIATVAADEVSLGPLLILSGKMLEAERDYKTNRRR